MEAMKTAASFPTAKRPKYSIACLIYKSVEWLEFSYQQVLKYTPLEDVEFYYVANNATPEVLEYLRSHHIPHYNFTTTPEQRKEWYINDVYRAWNYAGQQAKGEFLVFINSDMAFTPDWLEKLINAYDGNNCVSSRLIESGKLRTGTYGIERNFGRSIAGYKEAEFQEYARAIQGNEIKDGGLFMPLLINRDHFRAVGGYPEGNMKEGSDIFKPEIAERGEPLVSGDVVLMQKLATKGVKHQTSFGSVVYHFQEGEMDEKPHSVESITPEPIAIVNDIVTGTMGEKVLWDFLIESIPGAFGVDQRLVGRKNFESAAKEYIDAHHPDTKIIIQNATFIGTIDPTRHTIAFLQDDLRKMGRANPTQEKNLAASGTVVANSVQTAASYPEYEPEVISVGVDADLFKPGNKQALRKKHNLPEKKQIGIFVGRFNEVKGWSKVSEAIKKYHDIHWLCVTKHEEDTFEAKNVSIYRRVDQQLLNELLNCADFFILGSPVETQCLAAVEAALCDVPVIMPLTGIFEDFSQEERDQIGIFGNDLIKAVKAIATKKFAPRKLILEKGLTVETAMDKWRQLVAATLLKENSRILRGEAVKAPKKMRPGMLLRKVVLKRLIGREYIFPGSMGHALLSLAYKFLLKIGLGPLIKKIRG